MKAAWKGARTEWWGHVPVTDDKGRHVWDVRYDNGTVDIMIDGVNTYTLSLKDAMSLVSALTKVVAKGLAKEEEKIWKGERSE